MPFLSGAIEVFVTNLHHYLRGEELVGLVDIERGY
jgi:hypothetical protein